MSQFVLKLLPAKKNKIAWNQENYGLTLPNILSAVITIPASVAKSKVEDAQRHLTRLRTEAGISWHPKFFIS